MPAGQLANWLSSTGILLPGWLAHRMPTRQLQRRFRLATTALLFCIDISLFQIFAGRFRGHISGATFFTFQSSQVYISWVFGRLKFLLQLLAFKGCITVAEKNCAVGNGFIWIINKVALCPCLAFMLLLHLSWVCQFLKIIDHLSKFFFLAKSSPQGIFYHKHILKGIKNNIKNNLQMFLKTAFQWVDMFFFIYLTESIKFQHLK